VLPNKIMPTKKKLLVSPSKGAKFHKKDRDLTSNHAKKQSIKDMLSRGQPSFSTGMKRPPETNPNTTPFPTFPAPPANCTNYFQHLAEIEHPSVVDNSPKRSKLKPQPSLQSAIAGAPSLPVKPLDPKKKITKTSLRLQTDSPTTTACTICKKTALDDYYCKGCNKQVHHQCAIRREQETGNLYFCSIECESVNIDTTVSGSVQDDDKLAPCVICKSQVSNDCRCRQCDGRLHCFCAVDEGLEGHGQIYLCTQCHKGDKIPNTVHPTTSPVVDHTSQEKQSAADSAHVLRQPMLKGVQTDDSTMTMDKPTAVGNPTVDKQPVVQGAPVNGTTNNLNRKPSAKRDTNGVIRKSIRFTDVSDDDSEDPLIRLNTQQRSKQRDQPTDIQLKENQHRPFIHRYDLKVEIKSTETESECEKLIIKQLHLFFSLILQADSTSIIPPYLSLDRSAGGFTDLSSKFPVTQVQGFTAIKRYFSRIFPRIDGGQFYCNIILATTASPDWLQNSLRQHLRDHRFGLWRRSIDCEQVSEIGWLLYSTRQQDVERISQHLSYLTKEKVGARWRTVRTSNTFQRRRNTQSDKSPPIQAIHLECDSRMVQSIKYKIAKLYSSTTNTFPDGTKMRLIPPISTIISKESKEKYGLVVARQAAFTSKIATGTSWEFSQNLLLDHKHKTTGLTLREAIMGIESSKYPGLPVFHTVDKAWGSDNGVNFNFLPENESEARMYIAGLIPYLRDSVGEWFLHAFSTEAIERHSDSVFDPASKQIYSTSDAWVNNSLLLDQEFNFTDNPSVGNVSANVPLFQATNHGTSYFNDIDSVSTFRSKHSQAINDHKGDTNTDGSASPETSTADSSATVNANTLPQTDAQEPNKGMHDGNTPIAGSMSDDTSGHRPTVRSPLIPSVTVSTKDQAVSSITDMESKYSKLESYVTSITDNMEKMLHQIHAQQTKYNTNQQEMLSIIQTIMPIVNTHKGSTNNPQATTQPTNVTISPNTMQTPPSASATLVPTQNNLTLTGGQDGAASIQANPLHGIDISGGKDQVNIPDKSTGHGL
jgi:hypothetical protein